MPRCRVEPYNVQGPFSENGQGEGRAVESLETTLTDNGNKSLFYSGFSAKQTSERHQREEVGTIYVNYVSRKIVNQDYQGASNAPVYNAMVDSPVYTLFRQDGKIMRAYWPVLSS